MKIPNFRQYHECHNGHPRFLYWKHKNGFVNEAWWGSRHPDCKCSTFSLGDGFDAKHEPEMCLPIRGKDGQLLFEGDVYLDCENMESDIDFHEDVTFNDYSDKTNSWGFHLFEQEFDQIDVIGTKHGWKEPNNI